MSIPATVIGTLNVDVNLYVDRISPPGGESKVLRIKRTLGGKGGNVMAAFAKLAGGGRFVGAVGDDEAGRMHIEEFKRLNVDASGIRAVKELESGQSFVLVDKSGQNQVNSYYGANAALDASYILSERVSEIIGSSRVVIAANVSPEVASAAFSVARGVRAYVPASFAVREPESVCRVSGEYVFLNEEEMDGVKGCISGSFRRVVVTMGSRGAMMLGGPARVTVPGVNLEPFGMKVSSTVGAGDAFTGAFMAAIYNGLKDEQALKVANYAAALKVTRDEARGSATLEELARFLREAGENIKLWGAVG